MAAAFGTTPLVASFWMAFRFAHLLRRLFGEGALNVAFVPHFEALRKKDPASAAHFFHDLTFYLRALLFFVTVISEMVLGGFLLWGDLREENAQVVTLTMIMLPALVFISLHALNSSLLQCERSYFLPSVSPIIVNLIWIASLGLLWHLSQERAIVILSVVVVFGFFFQWLATALPASRVLVPILEKKKRKGKEIFALLRPFLLSVIGVTATQINSALDALFARGADPEGPAFLWYALRLQQLPLALFGVGLSGALLPPIARAMQASDFASCRRFLQTSLTQLMAFMIPVSGAILAMGALSVNLIFGRGAFDDHSIAETTLCLMAYGIGLLPMSSVLIFASFFYAMKDYKTPTLLSLLSVVTNIVLNALFVYGFKMGAVSIAMATTIAALGNAWLLAHFLSKKLGRVGKGMGRSFLKMTFCTASSVIVTLVLSRVLIGESTIALLFRGEMLTFPKGVFLQLMHFAVSAVLFGGTLFGMAYVFRVKEWKVLIGDKI